MPPEPNDQMVTEPELGDAELQQWLTSLADGAEISLPGLDIGVPISSRKPPTELHTGEQGGAPDEEPTDDDEPTGDDDEETPSPGTPEGSADFFVVNGQQFPREDIERLYNFDQYLRANPDIAARVNTTIAEAARGQAALPPAQTTPTDQGRTEPPAVEEWKDPEPPDFLDMEDPAQKFQWETHVATQKVLFNNEQRQRQFFAQQAEEQTRRNNAQAQQDMATALASFKQSHPNLNEDDIAKIRKAAAPFVAGMMQQLPPVEALSRSMEVAGMMDNDLRTKILDETVKTRSAQQQSRHRKARLGELSGSGRSAPRTEAARPAFTSDKEFLNALAAEFSDHMQR